MYDGSGPGLRLLAFTCELDLVERDKSMANASCSMKFVESVMELTKLELSLTGDNAAGAQRVPFGYVEV